MGAFLSRVFKKLFKDEIRVLMLGLDAAGKTSILYKLKIGGLVYVVPTIGFNLEEINHNGKILSIWDVGGGDKIHALWRHYFEGVKCVVYVVDANDKERLDISARELHDHLLSHEEIKNIPFLIFANKQDLKDVLTVEEIAAGLCMDDRVWHIQPCCAVTGQGLNEGLDWIIQNISK